MPYKSKSELPDNVQNVLPAHVLSTLNNGLITISCIFKLFVSFCRLAPSRIVVHTYLLAKREVNDAIQIEKRITR